MDARTERLMDELYDVISLYDEEFITEDEFIEKVKEAVKVFERGEIE